MSFERYKVYRYIYDKLGFDQYEEEDEIQARMLVDEYFRKGYTELFHKKQLDSWYNSNRAKIQTSYQLKKMQQKANQKIIDKHYRKITTKR